jgi:hypothetical protein
MNTIPCEKCKHYDPILGPGRKPGNYGWCIIKSKYPAQEGPGQVFPPGVQRVEKGRCAEPHIVKNNLVVGHCNSAIRKKD